jgi:hypothetical protein
VSAPQKGLLFVSAPQKGLLSMLDGIKDYKNRIRKTRFPYKSTSIIVSYRPIRAFCLFLRKPFGFTTFVTNTNTKFHQNYSTYSWQWRDCHTNVISSAYACLLRIVLSVSCTNYTCKVN